MKIVNRFTGLAFCGPWDNLDTLKRANLTGAKLAGADLGFADLTSAKLTDANLRFANLTGANLTGANLWGADLRFADLTCAKLAGANLTGANLTGANLWGADLRGAKHAPIHTHLDHWAIYIHNGIVTIGCQEFPFEEFLALDENSATVAKYNAEEFARRWGDMLKSMVRTYMANNPMEENQNAN